MVDVYKVSAVFTEKGFAFALSPKGDTVFVHLRKYSDALKVGDFILVAGIRLQEGKSYPEALPARLGYWEKLEILAERGILDTDGLRDCADEVLKAGGERLDRMLAFALTTPLKNSQILADFLSMSGKGGLVKTFEEYVQYQLIQVFAI